jgi:Xaa-Pro aminopeptidase
LLAFNAAAGLDQYRQHTTGYGMAAAFPPAWGEATNMFGDSRDVLEAGMVITVESAISSRRRGWASAASMTA